MTKPKEDLLPLCNALQCTTCWTPVSTTVIRNQAHTKPETAVYHTGRLAVSHREKAKKERKTSIPVFIFKLAFSSATKGPLLDLTCDTSQCYVTRDCCWMCIAIAAVYHSRNENLLLFCLQGQLRSCVAAFLLCDHLGIPSQMVAPNSRI